MSSSAVPRYPLGEYAYQGLWWGVVLLPGLIVILRVLTMETGMTFFLMAALGLPAVIAGQLIAGFAAWTFRRRQWRHFLGRFGAVLSFVYYGAWVLLALALPDATPDDGVLPSLSMRWFGQDFAEGLSGLLFWAIPILYLALLGAIIIEGWRAVRHWRAVAAQG